MSMDETQQPEEPRESAPAPAGEERAERPQSEGPRPEGMRSEGGYRGGDRGPGGPPGRRAPGGGPGGRAMGRRPRRKVCSFCVEKGPAINYKDVSRMRRFVTERGKILPRRTTGNCAIHQRALARAVKRAREIALLPFVAE